tara:strand:- start:5 stop:295 length:291 start_codon:yes stop_codon:yes gene_type:complete
MEISLQQSAAPPLAYPKDSQGAAKPAPDAPEISAEKPVQLSVPAQLSAVGAVNETRFGTLKTVKPVIDEIDRTLKPYDTVMLPFTVSEENSIRRLA